MQVANVNWVLNHVVAKFVGRTKFNSTLDSASRQQRGEALGMMVAAIRFMSQRSLAVNRPSEFSSKHDQCVFQEPALVEILNESRGGLVDVLALGGQVRWQ